MTPSDLLSPQPPTVPGEDQRPVWGLILDDLLHGSLEEWLREHPSPSVGLGRVTELCRARDTQGAAKYGHRLPVDSGRDSRKDELQEALDGMAYSRQTAEQERSALKHLRGEDADGYYRAMRLASKAWDRHLRCLQTVLELLEELGA